MYSSHTQPQLHESNIIVTLHLPGEQVNFSQGPCHQIVRDLYTLLQHGSPLPDNGSQKFLGVCAEFVGEPEFRNKVPSNNPQRLPPHPQLVNPCECVYRVADGHLHVVLVAAQFSPEEDIARDRRYDVEDDFVPVNLSPF